VLNENINIELSAQGVFLEKKNFVRYTHCQNIGKPHPFREQEKQKEYIG